MDDRRQETFLRGAEVCGFSTRADGGGVRDAPGNSGKPGPVLATFGKLTRYPGGDVT